MKKSTKTVESVTINPKWFKLAGVLLTQSSDEFSHHVCNDWDFPSNWTKKEKVEMVKAYHEANGDPEEFDPDYLNLADFEIMWFLGKVLQEAAKKLENKKGGR